MDRYDATGIAVLLCLVMIALVAGSANWWVFGLAAAIAMAAELWRTSAWRRDPASGRPRSRRRQAGR